MIDKIAIIKKITLAMRSATSVNDDRYERLTDISDICDDMLTHFIDDGK